MHLFSLFFESFKSLKKEVSHTLLADFAKSDSGQWAANFETLWNDGWSDQLVGWDLLHESIISGLVEENQVVQLVPGFSLWPFLKIFKINCVNFWVNREILNSELDTFFFCLLPEPPPPESFAGLSFLSFGLFACGYNWNILNRIFCRLNLDSFVENLILRCISAIIELKRDEQFNELNA
jgi:hypothetical protein